MSSAPDLPAVTGDDRPLLVIAEPSPTLRRGWARSAAALGFARVREAATLAEARAALADRPAVLLTAAGIPGAAPLALVAEARTVVPPPFVIVLSDRADRASVEAARAAGVDRYVVRPVAGDALERALAAAPGLAAADGPPETAGAGVPEGLPRAA